MNIDVLFEDLKDDAKDYFGTTWNWRVGLYINTDGSILDGSGKKLGSDGSSRAVDHREVSDIFKGSISGDEAMIAYMNEGNIRWKPEAPGFELIKEPTAEQYKTLARLLNYIRGEFYVDIDNEKGFTVESQEFSSPRQAINFVMEYFDNSLREDKRIKSNGPDLSKVEYYHNAETNTTHAIVKYKGKRTRLRSGVLIIKDDTVLVSHEANEEELSLPGGGLEENETPIDAGIRECQEEVRINVKNCRETGHNYCTDENVIADWVKTHVPEDKQWVNYFTYLLIADYDSEFEGKVAKIDQDKSMLENMKWVKFEEAIELPTFRKEWKLALADAGYIEPLDEGVIGYHGSAYDFDVFRNDIKYGRPTLIWFAEDGTLSADYADGEETGKSVTYKADLDLGNCLDLTSVQLANLALIRNEYDRLVPSHDLKNLMNAVGISWNDMVAYIKKVKNNPDYGIFSLSEIYCFDLVKVPEFLSLIKNYDSVKCHDLSGDNRIITTYGVKSPRQIKIIDKKVTVLNESLLEDTRTTLINKSRNAGDYKDQTHGKNRFDRKKYSKVASTVKAYNQLDMNDFFKKDILTIKIPVTGETDSYTVSIKLNGVVAEIQKEIKNNQNKLEFKTIIQSLTKIFNTTNVYVNCTCPDYLYNFDHWNIVKNVSVNDNSKDPGAGKNIANPNDDKGRGCKHVLLVLNNGDWMMKVASCIKNYIFYAEEHMTAAFNKLIFPKLYNITVDDAIDNNLVPEDINLDSEKHIIEVINDWAKNRGKIQKGSNKNPVKGKGVINGPKEEEKPEEKQAETEAETEENK